MIGRTREIEQLTNLYNRNSAELVAIYGRRRVGKTYLVDEVFNERITFRHAGLSPIEMEEVQGAGPMKKQLQAFYFSLLYHGMKRTRCPKDWLEAFYMLEVFLNERDNGSRQVVFLDEFPWMDTNKSGFVTAFEAFWNGWGCHRKNLMVIVCGSASSWIMDKLINNHGGLYNRVTYEIKLEPFTLKECEEYLLSQRIHFSRYDIAQSYMIVGGIPYYLNYYERGKSLAQNVDALFYEKNAKLKDEYNRMFSSVFRNPETMKSIVELLNRRSAGYTRQELSSLPNMTDGGNLSENLNALIASDFIMKYVPFGAKKREAHYKLIDPFCIFFLRFVKGKEKLADGFWQQNVTSQKISTWRGYAFENLCFNHIQQIKKALGISSVSTEQSSWIKRGTEEDGSQIDLIIERKDNLVNMCEIKFYSGEFTVNKAYNQVLRDRKSMLEQMIGKRFVIHSTLISTFGHKKNEYGWIFDSEVVLDDLFG